MAQVMWTPQDARPVEPSSTNLNKMKVTVTLQKGEDGWIVAKSPDIQGAISQGRTKDEAIRNIVDAMTGLLEERGKHVEEFLVVLVEE